MLSDLVFDRLVLAVGDGEEEGRRQSWQMRDHC